MPYGPFTVHNGQPAPHLAGKRVLTTTQDLATKEVIPVDGHGGSWTWRDGYTRVLSYRVWLDDREQGRERAQSADLENGASLPQPLDPDHAEDA